MSRVAIEIVLEVHDELARNPKELMWLIENSDFKCMKLHHVNKINNL